MVRRRARTSSSELAAEMAVLPQLLLSHANGTGGANVVDGNAWVRCGGLAALDDLTGGLDAGVRPPNGAPGLRPVGH